MAPKPGYRKGYVSGPVKAFCLRYWNEKGRVPLTKTIMAAMPEFESSYEAVKKARNAWRRSFLASQTSEEVQNPTGAKAAAPPKAPKSRPTGEYLAQRIEETSHMIEVLKTRAEAGDVDAHQFDKLCRLERQLKAWQKEDSEMSAREREDAFALPNFAQIIKRAGERKSQGISLGGPRNPLEGKRDVG